MSERLKHHRQRLFVLQHLATAAEAGMPLHRAMRAAVQETEPRLRWTKHYDIPIDVGRFALKLGRVADALEHGEKLSEALMCLPTIFRRADLILIASAESSGTLPNVLKLMLRHTRKRLRQQDKILALAVYPGAQLFIVATTLTFLSIFIWPKFSVVIREITEQVVGWKFAGMLPVMMQAFKWSWAVALVVWIVLMLLVRTGFFRLVREALVMEFSGFMELFLAAQLRADLAVEAAAEGVRHRWFARRMKEARTQIRNGRKLSDAMESSQVFSPTDLWILRNGEQRGALATSFGSMAEFHAIKVVSFFNRYSDIFASLGALVIGVLVGLIAYSVFSGLVTMMKGLQ